MLVLIGANRIHRYQDCSSHTYVAFISTLLSYLCCSYIYVASMLLLYIYCFHIYVALIYMLLSYLRCSHIYVALISMLLLCCSYIYVAFISMLLLYLCCFFIYVALISMLLSSIWRRKSIQSSMPNLADDSVVCGA